MWISKFLSDESGFLQYLRRKLPIPVPGVPGLSGYSGYSGLQGGAHGIDDVLAIQQLLTQNRTLDIQNNLLYISGNEGGNINLQVTNNDLSWAQMSIAGIEVFLRAADNGSAHAGIIEIQKDYILFDQTQGLYEFNHLNASSDFSTNLPIAANTSGDIVRMSSWPSWDTTLAVNPEAIDKVPKLTITTDRQNFFMWQSDGYAPGSGVDRFYAWFDSTFVNGVSGRQDIVGQFWGYNWGANGIVTAGEAAFSYRTETFWEQSGNLMEFHMPEIYTTTGINSRLISIYADRDNGISFLNFCMDAFNYISTDNVNQPYFGLDHAYGIGNITMIFDASLGSGGVLGDQTNFARIQLLDGSGGLSTIFATPGGLQISTYGEIDLFGDGLIGLNATYLRWTSAPGFTILFEGMSSGVPSVGFDFYNQGQTVQYFSIWDQTNVSWTAMNCQNSLAAFGRYLGRMRLVNAVDTQLTTDQFIRFGGAGGFNFQLLSGSIVPASEYSYTLRLRNDSAGNVTLLPDGAETIMGGANLIMAAGDVILLCFDEVNTDWVVFN